LSVVLRDAVGEEAFGLLCRDGLREQVTLRAAAAELPQGVGLRFEEITRCVPDVQDALVSILSDKNIAIPELPDAITFPRKTEPTVLDD
jgi:MoxR-like ATPase